MLEYDVLTVSQDSGDSNVLAYRTGETSLFVPYDWLDPNDTISFVLKSNDSRKTLTAVSDEFVTPDGDKKDIIDGDGGLSWQYIIVIAAVIIVIAAITIIVIVVIRKNKK